MSELQGTSIQNRTIPHFDGALGIDHSWQAEEDTVIITIRWPSASADADRRA
jgi:hypothetical protein